MSEEGYLQIKLREQSEEIKDLNNKIKTLEKKIDVGKQAFDNATYLLLKAGDINKFKKQLAEETDIAVKKLTKFTGEHFKEKIDFIQSNNQKWLDDCLDTIGKLSKERINGEMTSFVAALSKIFIEKNIMTTGEIERLIDYHTEKFEKWRNERI